MKILPVFIYSFGIAIGGLTQAGAHIGALIPVLFVGLVLLAWAAMPDEGLS